MHEMRLTVPRDRGGESGAIDVVRVTIRNLQKDGSLKHATWAACREVRSTQWLYSYGGWSLERDVLRLLAKFQIMHVHFYNVDSGVLLTSRLRDWRDHGLSVDFGGVEHVILPDKYWTADEKDYTTSRFVKNKHKTELLLRNFAEREAQARQGA